MKNLTLKKALRLSRPFCSKDKERSALWHPIGDGLNIWASDGACLSMLRCANPGQHDKQIIFFNRDNAFIDSERHVKFESLIGPKPVILRDQSADVWLVKIELNTPLSDLRSRPVPNTYKHNQNNPFSKVVQFTGEMRILNSGPYRDEKRMCLDIRYLYRVLKTLKALGGTFKVEYQSDLDSLSLIHPMGIFLIMPTRYPGTATA